MTINYTTVFKAILSSLLFLLLQINVSAQSPQLLNYQAALRDAEGKILAEKNTKLRISILEDNISGAPIYTEEHQTTTTAQGLVNFQIGAGKNASSNFADINWSNGNKYFLKIEVEEGGSYTTLGTSQLVSVPYALFSNKAAQADTAAVLANAPWFLNGNSGTDTNSFIGTLDEQDLVFKTNNEKKMTLGKDGSFYVGDTGIVETVFSTMNGSSNIFTMGGLLYNKNRNALRAGLLIDTTFSSIYNPSLPRLGSTTLADLHDDSLGNGSIAMGIGCKALGAGSISLGIHNKAGNNGDIADGTAIAMGYRCVAGWRGVAMGYEAEAIQNGDVAIGWRAKATGGNAVALGDNSTASGYSSFAANGWAIGGNSVALMGIANGQFSSALAMGTANGVNSSAIGQGVISNSYSGLAIGRFNDSMIAPQTDLSANHPAFIIGNGYEDFDWNTFQTTYVRSNAMVVYFNGNATLAGTLTQNSDRRLKKNIQSLNPVLAKVQKMEGVSYYWNGEKGHDSTQLQIGLIAQEVEKIFPELVTTESNGYKSVNYIGLVPVLIEAIKELKQEVSTKDNMIGKLRAEHNELRNQVNSILVQLEQGSLAGK